MLGLHIYPAFLDWELPACMQLNSLECILNVAISCTFGDAARGNLQSESGSKPSLALIGSEERPSVSIIAHQLLDLQAKVAGSHVSLS